MIPPKIHPAVTSSAERRVFDWIRDEPGTADWICLHSVGLSEHEAKRRAEIDFLLLTRLGIFVIEVKGGRVARENGVWKFTDRYGKTSTKTEGPFDQASSAMFGLEKRLREHFDSVERRQKRLLFGFGVVTPDTRFGDLLGTEAERRQLYDRDNVTHGSLSFREFVQQLADYWRERSSLGDNPGRYAPTEKDLDAILKFLRGDFDRVPSLGAVADASTYQMHALEAEQYHVLDAMEKYPIPRIVVQVGAGTGKTLLAVEIAKREAQKTDGDVLLLCFNRVLAGVLRHNVKAPQRGSITVRSIHALLSELINNSELSSEFDQKKAGLEQSEIVSRLIPEYGFRALMENDCKFVLTDVDELTPEWWRGVAYVGMSRARIGLYLLVNKRLKPLCSERQKDWLRKNPPDRM